MRKTIIFVLVVLGCLLFAASALAAKPLTVTLEYGDIDARVISHNSAVRAVKLAQDEANNAVKEAWKDYYEQKVMGANPTREQIQQHDRDLKSQNMKYEQTLIQQINAARHAFLRAGQLQNSIELQRVKLEQAEKALLSVKTRLARGLAAPSAVSEAERELNTLEAELNSLENQLQTTLLDLKSSLGYQAEDTLLPAAMPQVDPAYLASISLENNMEEAVKNNYSIKQLHAERSHATNAYARKRLDVQIAEQQANVRHKVEQKYFALLEAAAKLELTGAELARDEQKTQAAETNFLLGRISQMALDKQKAALAAKLTAQKNTVLSLLAEIENYQALLAGCE